MVIKITRWYKDNRQLEITLSTDYTVHSMLSDNPDLKEKLTTSVQNILDECIGREKANETTIN